MIKKIIVSGLTLLWLFQLNGQVVFTNEEWKDVRIFEINQTDAHTPLIPYANEQQALRNDRSATPYYMSLDGTWKFSLFDKPADVPSGFFRPEFRTSRWDNIAVPSNWQMEGFGHGKFRNIALTFISDPPNVPENYNPTGCYVRTFRIPRNWDGREIFLHFEGVKSASYVWINGQAVGYNQGGFEPAEYNVTPFIKRGENTIAVKVLSYSDGSYIENQDMWRLSGIFRTVYLFAAPEVHMRDYYVVTELDQKYEDAELQLEIDLINYSNSVKTGYSVEVELINDEDKITPTITRNAEPLEPGREHKLSIRAEVKNPLKWSAEKPHLYTMIIRLKDESGNLTEVYSKRIGFRKVEIKDSQILVNGVPIKFNGVNLHMHHPKHGQALPVETLRQDLIIMKQFNINLARTSHYPPSLELMELADELGMYIVDEAGTECHRHEYISEWPEWRPQFVDRSRKMVLRDRNYTSIIFWSAGNECGEGENIEAVIEEGKRLDPSRPGWMYGGNNEDIPFEDIVGARYWSPLNMKRLADGEYFRENDDRPSFMDEYLAATGNSLGGLDEYWELIWRYPRLTGGAIWDWISPGIEAPVKIVKDKSPAQNHGAIMGRAGIVEGRSGNGVFLSGHDDWVEFYRDRSLDVNGHALVIEFWLKPFEIDNRINTFLSKGSHQYGIVMSDRDSLEFYVSGQRRASAKARVSGDWYGNWHHVAGIYNGKQLELYIDYEKVASTPFGGSLRPGPYPLCIGRNVERHDQGEFSGQLSSGVFDDIRIYDKPLTIEELRTQSMAQARESAILFVDFEDITNEGHFYSTGLGGRTYGIVWPDRSIQPEIWQIKKSAQPVLIEAMDLPKARIRITNRFNFTNLNELEAVWKITDNKGIVNGSERFQTDIPPGGKAYFTIPQTPVGDQILEISFTLKEAQSWAPQGHEVAWEQFRTGKPEEPEFNHSGGVEPANVHEEGDVIIVSGSNFKYELDRKSGIFRSMSFGGKNLFNDGPRFNVWRPLLANDIDPWGNWQISSRFQTPGFGVTTQNEWLTIGVDSLTSEACNYKVGKNNNGEITISFVQYNHARMRATAFENQVVYTINGAGELKMNVKTIPHGPMPNFLPKMGFRFKAPREYNLLEWYGRGPFETYPDRKTGAKVGLYNSTVEDEYVPYLIPQDHGNKNDVEWILLSNGETGIWIGSSEAFNFSAHIHSTDNLNRAMYPFQLKSSGYTTLNIDHRVGGLGDTSDLPMTKYRIYPETTEVTYMIRPVKQGSVSQTGK
ncbi:MAG: glycoside hydrolase family 2 TIM barrel-domain containing protein [Bacteroidales bacterium]